VGKLQPARGTRDIYGEDMVRMRRVADLFLETGRQFGFGEIATPIFEFAEVFKRPLGEASDIVSKEMYGFEDRGGEELTLRPEFTAGVCRAFISNGMQQHVPVRWMSHGPAFRYERPQKGRYRQFHQINAEMLGAADPETDVDMLSFAWRFLTALGVADEVTLHFNSLGDPASRASYREALIAYFQPFVDDLSEDSQRRLGQNPLRILDSKNERDKEISADAPVLHDHLNAESRAFFDRVRAGLDVLGVPYVHDTRLVRGLDYYTHSCFEFITDALGAQGTVIGGGRYDGLIKQLGGAPTPGIGFAGGMERLAMLLSDLPKSDAPVVMIPMDAAAFAPSLTLANDLRAAGIVVISERSGKMGKRLNRADQAGARFAVILGETEVASGMATVRDLTKGEQASIAFANLAAYINTQETGA